MRPRRGEPSARTKILAASRRLFSQRGFAETSVGTIATNAKVSRATVYNNFEDKREILAVIVENYMTGYRRIAQQLREEARPGQTTFELIETMIAAALTWRVENADIRPLIAVAQNTRGTGWEEADRAVDEAIIEWIASVHASDRDAGLIREEIELEFAVRATYAMIESVLSRFDVSRRSEIDKAARQLALLHWYAISSVEPEEASSGRAASGAATD